MKPMNDNKQRKSDKRLSLHPLQLEEAVKGILKAKPNKDGKQNKSQPKPS